MKKRKEITIVVLIFICIGLFLNYVSVQNSETKIDIATEKLRAETWERQQNGSELGFCFGIEFWNYERQIAEIEGAVDYLPMPIIIENLDNIQHKCATRDSELVKTIQSRIENAGKDRKRFDTVIRGYSCEEYDDLCGGYDYDTYEKDLKNVFRLYLPNTK